jgi:hypothetical protein
MMCEFLFGPTFSCRTVAVERKLSPQVLGDRANSSNDRNIGCARAYMTVVNLPRHPGGG